MTPANFPARKLYRKMRAELPPSAVDVDGPEMQAARQVRTKKDRRKL